MQIRIVYIKPYYCQQISDNSHDIWVHFAFKETMHGKLLVIFSKKS